MLALVLVLVFVYVLAFVLALVLAFVLALVLGHVRESDRVTPPPKGKGSSTTWAAHTRE